MKITEISVFKDRKLQVRQFEPFSFGYGAKAEVNEGEDIAKAYSELETFVDEQIEKQTKKLEEPVKEEDNNCPF